jgi:hypothetical protein
VAAKIECRKTPPASNAFLSNRQSLLATAMAAKTMDPENYEGGVGCSGNIVAFKGAITDREGDWRHGEVYFVSGG